MNNAVKQIKKLAQKTRDVFPTALPRGLTEFNVWSKSIIDTYDLPDNDSTVFALAIMISQLSPTTASKTKRYFVNSARKSMSNQIAFQVAQDLKQKQKAEQEAAEKAKQVEATTESQPVASNVHAIQG